VTNTSDTTLDLVCMRVMCNYTAIPWNPLPGGGADPVYQANENYWRIVRAYYSFANIDLSRILDQNITTIYGGTCELLEFGGGSIESPPTCRVTCNRCVTSKPRMRATDACSEPDPKKLSGTPMDLMCSTPGEDESSKVWLATALGIDV
jgi:hypothetical protein